MDWTEAMNELNTLLESIKEDGVLTKEDVLREVKNVFENDDEEGRGNGKG